MYFKTKNLTILFIFFSSFLFSQTITTKFIRSGYLTDNPKSLSISTCEFKKKKEVTVIDFMGDKWWKVNYNSCIGYVTSPFILITDELIELRENKYKELQIEIKRKNDLIEYRNDSIEKNKLIDKKRIEEIKLNILDYVNDSLLIVTVKKGSILKQSPDLFGEILMTLSENKEVLILDYLNDYFKVCIDLNCGYISEVFFTTGVLGFNTNNVFLSEFKKVKEIENQKNIRKEKLEKYEKEKNSYFNECRYDYNEKDEFSGVKRKYTILYNLGVYGINYSELKIQLQRYGSSKYIRIISHRDLGCTSSYSSNKSNVKFKLENGDIVTFYHSDDIDCGKFNLLGKLTQNDINRLKKSPIKTVRLSGTDYYHDIKSVKWSTFFIDKLDCIK